MVYETTRRERGHSRLIPATAVYIFGPLVSEAYDSERAVVSVYGRPDGLALTAPPEVGHA